MKRSRIKSAPRLVEFEIQTWCWFLLKRQAHDDNRLIASLGMRVYPEWLKRGEQGLAKRHAKHTCQQTLMQASKDSRPGKDRGRRSSRRKTGNSRKAYSKSPLFFMY
jgi:hypothetical protein